MKTPSSKAAALVALLLPFLPVVSRAQFLFKTNNGTITITQYNGTGGEVIIPSSTNGFPVTALGAYAFQLCANVTRVSIPDSVTDIGYATFEYCRNLADVALPRNLTNIGTSAFQECTSLTNISMPNTVNVLERATAHEHYYLLELDPVAKVTKVTGYPANQYEKAASDYLETEKKIQKGQNADAVLVSVDSLSSLRRAYPNYFLDTHLFIDAVRQAIK